MKNNKDKDDIMFLYLLLTGFFIVLLWLGQPRSNRLNRTTLDHRSDESAFDVLAYAKSLFVENETYTINELRVRCRQLGDELINHKFNNGDCMALSYVLFPPSNDDYLLNFVLTVRDVTTAITMFDELTTFLATKNVRLLVTDSKIEPQ